MIYRTMYQVYRIASKLDISILCMPLQSHSEYNLNGLSANIHGYASSSVFRIWCSYRFSTSESQDGDSRCIRFCNRLDTRDCPTDCLSNRKCGRSRVPANWKSRQG